MSGAKVSLVVAGLLLCGQTAIADLRRKEALEVRKLELEVEKLSEEDFRWKDELTVLASLVVGIAGGLLSFRAARLARVGALDQATHEKRLAHYPALVAATAPLAIYFPGSASAEATSLAPEDCRAMGHAMSTWYFGEGGLLMSNATRDAYFRLARALTCASFADTLNVPVFRRDARKISMETLETYRAGLGDALSGRDAVEKWKFGVEKPSVEFQDYVFLQHLSSELRKALSEDLRSRKSPS